MDNSDGLILGVMEDKKGYEMFVFLWFTYSITCRHLTAISISILIYLCRLVDEVGKTRTLSVLDSVDEEAIAIDEIGKATCDGTMEA